MQAIDRRDPVKAKPGHHTTRKQPSEAACEQKNHNAGHKGGDNRMAVKAPSQCMR
jgi:hypothetical protein